MYATDRQTSDVRQRHCLMSRLGGGGITNAFQYTINTRSPYNTDMSDHFGPTAPKIVGFTICIKTNLPNSKRFVDSYNRIYTTGLVYQHWREGRTDGQTAMVHE